ncbi:hypothetical protein LINPERHAP1_LOCUS25597 [Linum perenne]
MVVAGVREEDRFHAEVCRYLERRIPIGDPSTALLRQVDQPRCSPGDCSRWVPGLLPSGWGFGGCCDWKMHAGIGSFGASVLQVDWKGDWINLPRMPGTGVLGSIRVCKIDREGYSELDVELEESEAGEEAELLHSQVVDWSLGKVRPLESV